jgi:hypothetical protein
MRCSGRAVRTLVQDVAAPPGQVRDFYVDLSNLPQTHPLVVSVKCTARREVAAGRQADYRVRDRIPLGPLTLPVVYAARITVATTGAVTAEARQFPGVRLNSRVTFDPIEDGTRVAEQLTIRAPAPLLGFTVGQAVKAHIAMLAAVARKFETR